MASVTMSPATAAARGPLSTAARIYIAAVITAGGAAIALSVPSVYPWTPSATTALTAMVVVSLFKLRLRVGPARATMTMAQFVDFWMIAAAGTSLATTIAVAGVLVQCLINVRQPQPWYRTAFSVGVIALAVRAAAYTWFVFGGAEAEGVATAAVALGTAALVYFVVNSGLVAWVIAETNGERPIECWRRRFLGTAPASLIAAAAVVIVRQSLLPGPVSMAALALAIAICYGVYARVIALNKSPQRNDRRVFT